MSKNTNKEVRERFERWCADNLNDGEYPIPEDGRMVQLRYAVKIISDFLESAISLAKEEQREEDVRMVESVSVEERKGLWLKSEHSKEDCVDMGYKLALKDAASLIRSNKK